MGSIRTFAKFKGQFGGRTENKIKNNHMQKQVFSYSQKNVWNNEISWKVDWLNIQEVLSL